MTGQELQRYVSERIHSPGINYIVENEYYTEDLEDLFFQGEPCIHIPPDKTMPDILVDAGVFPSRGQARKNWTRSGVEIPPGFSDFLGIGKKRLRISILCPTADNMKSVLDE